MAKIVCYLCGTRMVCVNDYNTESMRTDILACPKCKSGADAYYDRDGILRKLSWKYTAELSEFEEKSLLEKIKERK